MFGQLQRLSRFGTGFGDLLGRGGHLVAAGVLLLCLVPAAVWLNWSPFVPAICTNWTQLMLWTAVPLAAFAAVPILSLLKLKYRRLLPWTLFLGFLPYFAACPPFLFPFLAAFRARPSRFKRM